MVKQGGRGATGAQGRPGEANAKIQTSPCVTGRPFTFRRRFVGRLHLAVLMRECEGGVHDHDHDEGEEHLGQIAPTGPRTAGRGGCGALLRRHVFVPGRAGGHWAEVSVRVCKGGRGDSGGCGRRVGGLNTWRLAVGKGYGR